MSFPLAERFETAGGTARFLKVGGELAASAVASHAGGIAAEFSHRKHPWMVLSPDPEDVLGALLIAEQISVPLVVCHASLTRDQVEGIGESQGVGTILDQGLKLRQIHEAAHGGQGFSVLLMTSGTTGRPKVARHTIEHLLGRIRPARTEMPARWLLTYPATAFAGVQVLLSAILSGSDLICPENHDAASLASAAAERRATHVSGTPTFWRALLMGLGSEESLPGLKQVTLGGEIADQPTLDRLSKRFPQARIAHIYASTEAGAVFSVFDGLAGFPAQWLKDGIDGVQLDVREDILWVKSPRRMISYASADSGNPTEDGWLCTGDRVERSGERIRFLGRVGQILNIAGSKVSPVDVEAAILQVEGVSDALVYAVANPITGFVLAADIVKMPGATPDLTTRVAAHCRANLPPFQVPRIIRLASEGIQSYSGKKALRGVA
jgi:acyl-coenzyme A synthetase/AMP-(fatty) acid ligase